MKVNPIWIFFESNIVESLKTVSNVPVGTIVGREIVVVCLRGRCPSLNTLYRME